MINALLYTVVIPVGMYMVVPRLTWAIWRERGQRLYLIAACLLFAVAIHLPSPLIGGQQTQFATHLVGGIVVGLLWLYVRPFLPSMTWWKEFGLLFMVVSTLGTLNELYELMAYTVGMIGSINDTSYDLLANSLGILLLYGGFWKVKWLKRLFISR